MSAPETPVPPATDTNARRGFLAAGGAAIALAAVASACGSSDATSSGGLPVTGTFPPSPASADTAPSRERDVTLLRTAQSVEALAAQTYATVLAGGMIEASTSRELLAQIGDNHAAQIGAVGALVQQAGGAPHPQPNEYLDETVVQPALEAIETEADALALLQQIEALTSQTEIFAGEVLTTSALRAAISSIGSASARQSSVVLGLAGQPQVPFPLYPIGARAPRNAELPE